MTPLEVQAKAGDPAAVNELLRISRPRVRAIVCATFRHDGLAFDVLEEAFAEAMVTLWNCLPAWHGDAPLTAFAAEPIRRAARLTARRASRHGTIHRPMAYKDTNTIDPAFLVHHADPDAAIDARRVLAAMKPAQAALLWRIAANEEEQSEIADETGTSRQNIHIKYNRAVANARTLLAA